MAHKFARDPKDPYVEAGRQVEQHVMASRSGFEAGAGDELYDALGDAIVDALGDVAAESFRHGVNTPERMKHLAQAIAAAAEPVLLAYQGEVDPEPTLHAIEQDDRVATLSPEAKEKLSREIQNTRQLESLLLHARRLPDLIELAGSLGLHIEEDAIDQGELLVPGPTSPRSAP